ncbi:MAG: uroporphyrinogen decarboxylase family protein [Faecousia sp.]
MERDFAKLHEDVCFGRAGGKVIWQPRIQCWIDDKIFQDGTLPGKYAGMTKPEIYRELGCSARIYEYNDCFYPIYDDTIETWYESDGDYTTNYIRTPIGTVSYQSKSTPNSWARLTTKEWVSSEEELKIFTYIENHTDWGFSQETFDRVHAEWGNLGAPTIFMPRVSMQRLYIDLMGVEEAVYAVMDYPETVEAYFAALRECHFRLIDVINASPIRIINFGDNIHSGTLSPALFEQYVLPEYKLRCERLHKAGKFVCAHFDGDNRGLMKYYKETGLDGIEAITPVPQGDVTLEDVHEALGDMYLLDGIPAIYFDEIYPVQTLVECVHKILDLFAPHLILGISDEISSTGDIERVRLVGKIVDEYNAKLEQA